MTSLNPCLQTESDFWMQFGKVFDKAISPSSHMSYSRL